RFSARERLPDRTIRLHDRDTARGTKLTRKERDGVAQHVRGFWFHSGCEDRYPDRCVRLATASDESQQREGDETADMTLHSQLAKTEVFNHSRRALAPLA